MLRKNKPKEKPKSTLGKIWYFIWEEDSILSWVVNIILAIVLIKFVIYPGLGLALGTQFPIVAVVSDSMEHENFAKTQNLNFDEWWNLHEDFYDSKNISISEFKNYPYSRNGFNKGDLMILTGKDPSKIKKGDILVFMAWRPEPIIHRVVDIRKEDGQYIFQTKGDNNAKSIEPDARCGICDETVITEQRIVGKAFLRIPYLGWVKIAAVDMFLSVINLFR